MVNHSSYKAVNPVEGIRHRPPSAYRGVGPSRSLPSKTTRPLSERLTTGKRAWRHLNSGEGDRNAGAALFYGDAAIGI